MELRLETGDVIYSTDDHPYWSHKKNAMVSRNPGSTLSLYGFNASQLDDEEVFENEDGGPLTGRVSFGRRTASIIVDGVEVPDTMEVATLHLDTHHWFYVHGVRVHNKGGGGGCFDPTMNVTMANGSRKALMDVQVGDEVKSWDSETDSPTQSTVVGISKFWRESLMELRLESGAIIYSTD